MVWTFFYRKIEQEKYSTTPPTPHPQSLLFPQQSAALVLLRGEKHWSGGVGRIKSSVTLRADFFLFRNHLVTSLCLSPAAHLGLS